MKIDLQKWDILIWYGKSPKYPDMYSWYVSFGFGKWGFKSWIFWYDGPHRIINFGPFCISYCNPWIKFNEDEFWD